jgi:hypothetical protein
MAYPNNSIESRRKMWTKIRRQKSVERQKFVGFSSIDPPHSVNNARREN